MLGVWSGRCWTVARDVPFTLCLLFALRIRVEIEGVRLVDLVNSARE